jgi:cytochrome c biogenesis protein CcmG, thiol:disulfide interchange protein DsbE
MMTERSSTVRGGPSRTVGPGGIARRRLLYLLPAAGFAGLALALAWGLGRDPSEIPSMLIGKPVPKFSLPPVQGRQVSLVNAFASWCVACRAEHPLLMGLAASKAVPIHGLNYKDKPQDAAQWLDTMGDPYIRTGADLNGRVAIDGGVYGVPETYVVSADARIAHKHVGPLTEQDISQTILPLVQRLRAQTGRAGP